MDRPCCLVRPVRLVLVVVGLCLFPRSGVARPTGIAAQGCDGCHGGGGQPTVTLSANPVAPALGQVVTLTVTVSQTNGPIAGFFLTTEDINNGAFRAIETGTFANTIGVTHTMPRTGSGGVTTFKVEWSAAVATGVSFVVYALSANGDGTNRGDGGGSAALSLVSGCAGATYYLDQDGDGFGTTDPAYATRKACTAPLAYAVQTGDCNDFNDTIFPGAPELCDGKDNNCDGRIDEAVVNRTFCEDKDGDGHGILGAATKVDCAPSAGFGDCNGDCNDQNATVYPGAAEICDGHDNNCNGSFDEGVRMTCGTGWCRRYAAGCSAACTPGEPMVESCNYFDDDCDGVIDNGPDLQLCGAQGLTCVLGKCLPGTSSGGIGGGSVSGGGGAAGGGGGPTGAGNSGVGSGKQNGGCSMAPTRPVSNPGVAASVVIAVIGIATVVSRRKRRQIGMYPRE